MIFGYKKSKYDSELKISLTFEPHIVLRTGMIEMINELQRYNFMRGVNKRFNFHRFLSLSRSSLGNVNSKTEKAARAIP